MKTTISLATFLAGVPSCFAALSIEIQVGVLNTSTSAIVPDTSLWAIIYDDNGDTQLPGGLGDGTSLTAANTAQTAAAFTGATITGGGAIGDDRILAVFEVDGAGTSGREGLSIQTINLTDGEWSALSGRQWGIYWFPGLSIGDSTLTASFEIGGIRENAPNSGGSIGMTLPTFVAETSPTYTASALDDSVDVDGDLSTSRFTAIVVPEPATLTLAALGLTALLRRRRR